MATVVRWPEQSRIGQQTKGHCCSQPHLPSLQYRQFHQARSHLLSVATPAVQEIDATSTVAHRGQTSCLRAAEAFPYRMVASLCSLSVWPIPHRLEEYRD